VYHGKPAKSNISDPQAQYYGKGKPDYYKGGHQRPEAQGSRMGQQHGHYDQYGNYDPYYSASYYDPSSKSQDLSAMPPSHPKSQQFSESSQYQGFEKPKSERKQRLPAATEPTIKKIPKSSTLQSGVSSKEGQLSKKPQTYEEMVEKTPKSLNPELRGLASEEIGMTTTSWLQGAAAPNEKFIDDTIENINRKPGFNRLKKKKIRQGPQAGGVPG
jgi:hypothetical protein